MTVVRVTVEMDDELLRMAARALGTSTASDTVRAAMQEAVDRHRRAWLAQRDFSELRAALPILRGTALDERPDGGHDPDHG